jgi:hypothetical protein
VWLEKQTSAAVKSQTLVRGLTSQIQLLCLNSSSQIKSAAVTGRRNTNSTQAQSPVRCLQYFWTPYNSYNIDKLLKSQFDNNKMTTSKLTKFITLFVLVFCLTITSALAQSKSEEENLTTTFFKTFKTDPIKAYDNLFADNKWISKSDLETTKIKLKDYLADLGEFLGFEEITLKKAGESYILKSFLIKYDRQPVRFTFILYKPVDKWKIQNFSYDNNLSDELDAAAKLDRLKENW